MKSRIETFYRWICPACQTLMEDDIRERLVKRAREHVEVALMAAEMQMKHKEIELD